ncbi:hypothetical protein D8674_010499 [Pyrus ussuriensis x Pyrus communis]|uniref:Transmembrane protein n=1 Tax=Pyrus ussuriensis x Pyrus communis TaxID=2448454 RepID=A0A5N5FAW9_9ROSA|nr:hypothetical protein D8674_010499 [Pyrus ussuriensis x Pyrus communis]
MSETDGVFSHDHRSMIVKVLLDSLKIFHKNKQTFVSIFALTTLPLSLLLFSLSLSSHPLKSHIYHLESLARLAPTRFEARQVWKESRDDAISLLRIKVLFFFPSYALSLLASIAAVTAASTSIHGKRPTLRSSLNAVKITWKRPLVTSICIYALSIASALVPRTLSTVFNSSWSRLVIMVLGSGLEIYLMGMMGLGLVASILEERYGWDAIRVGWELMAGKKLCGWVMSGMFVLFTWAVARKLEEVMDGEDLMEGSSTATLTRVVVGIEDKLGWVILYGLVVLWGYVVTTVFYCDCRKRHVSGGGENEDGPD